MLVNEGFGAAMRSQPTAGLLLIVMSAVLAISLIGWRSGVTAIGEKMIVRASVLVLSLSGLANLLFQIRAER